jgi:hypothetical protein
MLSQIDDMNAEVYLFSVECMEANCKILLRQLEIFLVLDEILLSIYGGLALLLFIDRKIWHHLS